MQDTSKNIQRFTPLPLGLNRFFYLGLTRLPIFSSNAPVLDAVLCSTAYSVPRVFLNLG